VGKGVILVAVVMWCLGTVGMTVAGCVVGLPVMFRHLGFVETMMILVYGFLALTVITYQGARILHNQRRAPNGKFWVADIRKDLKSFGSTVLGFLLLPVVFLALMALQLTAGLVLALVYVVLFPVLALVAVYEGWNTIREATARDWATFILVVVGYYIFLVGAGTVLRSLFPN
jgi:hypothetical protein